MLPINRCNLVTFPDLFVELTCLQVPLSGACFLFPRKDRKGCRLCPHLILSCLKFSFSPESFSYFTRNSTLFSRSWSRERVLLVRSRRTAEAMFGGRPAGQLGSHHRRKEELGGWGGQGWHPHSPQPAFSASVAAPLWEPDQDENLDSATYQVTWSKSASLSFRTHILSENNHANVMPLVEDYMTINP